MIDEKDYARFVAYKVERHRAWIAKAKWTRERERWQAHAENLRMAAIVRGSIGRPIETLPVEIKPWMWR
jgi:hypothetical protein